MAGKLCSYMDKRANKQTPYRSLTCETTYGEMLSDSFAVAGGLERLESSLSDAYA